MHEMHTLLKNVLILEVRISPALETPPPITMISGSITLQTCANAFARILQVESTNSLAMTSPF